MMATGLSPEIIRPASAADLPDMGRLGALLVRTHYDFDALRFIAPSENTDQRYASYLGTQIENPNVVILVAELGGTVVGYTYAGNEGFDYMSLRGPAGVLYDIIVDPAQRGRGIGRLLLGATLDALTRLGAPRVVLSTAAKNAPAQRLFAGAGFRETMIEMTREAGPDSPRA